MMLLIGLTLFVVVVICVGLYSLYRENAHVQTSLFSYHKRATEAKSVTELENLRGEFSEWAHHHCWCPQYVEEAREVLVYICERITIAHCLEVKNDKELKG